MWPCWATTAKACTVNLWPNPLAKPTAGACVGTVLYVISLDGVFTSQTEMIKGLPGERMTVARYPCQYGVRGISNVECLLGSQVQECEWLVDVCTRLEGVAVSELVQAPPSPTAASDTLIAGRQRPVPSSERGGYQASHKASVTSGTYVRMKMRRTSQQLDHTRPCEQACGSEHTL